MRNVVISLAIGVGALLSSGANAAPLSVSPSMAPDTNVENVRLVCDEYGRCYRTRGGQRVVVASSFRRDMAIATIMPRANVISNGAHMMAATTTTGRASVSASVQAAWASALAWDRAGSASRKERVAKATQSAIVCDPSPSRPKLH